MWLVRGVLLLLGGLGLVAGIYILTTVPPTETSFYPKCMSYTVLGTHCPGCGTTRALHSLLNGEIRQSLTYNLWVLPALCYLGLSVMRYAWQRAWGMPRKPLKWPTLLIWVMVALYISYGVLRNIPIEPFNMLAPHRLSE
jgi:hypothetical protein